MSQKTIVAIVVAALIIAAGAYYALNKKDNSTPLYGSSNSSNTTTNTNASTSDKAVAAIITYSSSGFSPSSTTVKSGDTLEIKNTSSTDVQMQSDPHPSHTDDTDLNVGLVAAGQSKTFVVTKTGTFGFHNHLDPSQKGSITIQ